MTFAILALLLTVQQSDTIRINYANLLEIAEKYSPALKEIKFNINASRSGLAADIMSFLGSGEFSITKTENTYSSPPYSGISPWYSSTLNLSTNLLSSGNLFRTLSSYFDYRNNQVNLEDLRSQILLNLKTQYLNTIKLKKTSEAYTKALERSKLYYNLVLQRFKLGMVSKIDMVTAEIELKNAEINLLSSQNAYKKSLEQLRALIGVTDAGTALELEDYDPPVNVVLPDSPANIINATLRYNPSIKGSRGLMNAARTNVLYTITSFVPQVSFGKTWYYESSDLPEGLSNYNEKEGWTIRAYVNILNYPFSVLKNAELERAYSYRYKKTIYEAISKVRSSYEDLQYYFQTLELAKLRLEKAQSAYELASEQYKEGLISILQLMDTEASLLQSEVGLIEAKYNFTIAKENINYLAGMEVIK
jgi:outer membrane protein TolC